MYRPQFIYPLPPAPCEDQKCMYSFDVTNLPVLNHTLAAGARTGRIPLRLDKDADFYLRGINLQGPVSIRLEDTDGNPLSDSENAIDSTNYELPLEYGDSNGFGIVALESGAGGVFGPAGGNYVVYLFNAGTTTIELQLCAINLHGVKRYAEEVCRQ